MSNAWSERMKRTWDELAERNAMHYIATDRADWDRTAFLDSGERVVARLVGLARQWPPETPAGVALDLGCGIGRLSFALAKGFDRVVGVDVSETMVRKARALAVELGIQNVEFLCSNGRDLHGVADATCDFAFSYVVLQHMPSRQLILNAIAEFGRILKPGGQVVFQVPVYRPGLAVPPWRAVQRLFRLALAGAEAFHLVSPERGTAFRGTRLKAGELHDAITRAGLRLEVLERDPSRYRFCDDWVVVCRKH
jgi:SAM-dependent methyltransferase